MKMTVTVEVTWPDEGPFDADELRDEISFCAQTAVMDVTDCKRTEGRVTSFAITGE